MKIRPLEAELFHAADGRREGQTDIWTLIAAFRNFCQGA